MMNDLMCIGTKNMILSKINGSIRNFNGGFFLKKT